METLLFTSSCRRGRGGTGAAAASASNTGTAATDTFQIILLPDEQTNQISGTFGPALSSIGSVSSSDAVNTDLDSTHPRQHPYLPCLLCLADLPAYMIPGDLVRFLGGVLDCVAHIRVLRHCAGVDRYSALLHTASQDAVHTLLTSYHGQPFSSLEPRPCRLLRVAAAEEQPHLRLILGVEAEGEGAQQQQQQQDEEEDGHCTVCLEPLASSRTGASARDCLFSSACGHTSHARCLVRLESSQCPVCRFRHESHEELLSACADCGSGDDRDLWVCLVCGLVGCGALREDHIKRHYEATLHTYAVSTTTNAVYDFAGDGFVHRLILQRSDSVGDEEAAGSHLSGLSTGGGGKMVEVSSPDAQLLLSAAEVGGASSSSGGDSGRDGAGARKLGRPSLPGMSGPREEQVVSRRLEAAARRYSQEMTRRLESHRLELEARLLRHRVFVAGEANAGAGAGAGPGSWAARVRQQLAQERGKLVRQAEAARERLRAAEEERAVLQQLGASLQLNQQHWQTRLTAAQRTLMDAEIHSRTVLPPLENRVRELMTQLDACWIRKGGQPPRECIKQTVKHEKKIMEDNGPKHTSNLCRRWKRTNMNVLNNEESSWPPQSPDLNPLENLWAILDKKTRERKCNNEEELFQVLEHAWSEISEDTLRNLVESMPRRCAPAVIKSKGAPTKY